MCIQLFLVIHYAILGTASLLLVIVMYRVFRGYRRRLRARKIEAMIYRSRERMNWLVMDVIENPARYGSDESRQDFAQHLAENLQTVAKLEKMLADDVNLRSSHDRMLVVPSEEPTVEEVMGNLWPEVAFVV